MLRLLPALFAVVHLMCAADQLSLNDLKQRALKQALPNLPFYRMVQPRETLICAIPLKEFRVRSGMHMDPIAKPRLPARFDKIEHPAPIQACPSR